MRSDLTEPRPSNGVRVLVGGTVLAQGLTLLSWPIITRLYTQDDLGVLSVFSSLLSFLVAAASLSYEKAITIPKDSNEASAVLRLSLLLALLTSLASGVLIVLFGGAIAHVFHSENLIPYLWLLPLSLIGAGAYQALNFWAIREQAFGLIASTRVVQSVSQSVCQVVLGFLKQGVFGLLVGDAVGRAGGTWTVWRHAATHCNLRSSDREQLVTVAKKFRSFPAFTLGASMLHLAATALPPLLFAALYSKAMAGQYLLGQKVVWGPMALVGQAYAQVFVAQASKALHDEPSAIPEKIDQLTRRLLTLATLPMLPLVFAGGPIFAWAFGPQWAEAGYFMQILALTQLAQFVVGPIFPVLNLIGKQDALLKCDIFGFVTIVGGIVLCHALGGSPRQAIATYAVGTAAMYGALYFVSVRCARGLA